MPNQPTQGALTILDKAEFVSTSTRTQSELVSQHLTPVYGVSPSLAEDAQPTDWVRFQNGNADLLDSTAQEVSVSDRSLRDLIAEASRLRDRRDELIPVVSDELRDWRKIIDGTYGPAGLSLLGLDAPPPKWSFAIRKQSVEFLSRLQDPEIRSRLPEPRRGRVPVNFDLAASAVEADILALDSVMVELKKLGKRIDEARVRRNEALALLEERYLNVARIQEGLYRLAGLDELAARIRPFTRPTRRGSQEEDDETSQEADPSVS
jgi:hypothetical protein